MKWIRQRTTIVLSDVKASGEQARVALRYEVINAYTAHRLLHISVGRYDP